MNKPNPTPIPSKEETEYDKWFRTEVQAGLAEADDPQTEWIPHEVVEQEMLEELARLDALIEAGTGHAADLDSPSETGPASGDPAHRKC